MDDQTVLILTGVLGVMATILEMLGTRQKLGAWWQKRKARIEDEKRATQEAADERDRLKIVELEKRVASLMQDKISDLKERIATLEIELKTQQGTIQRQAERIYDLQKEVEKNHAARIELETEIKEAREMIEGLTVSNAKLTASNAELRSTNESYRQQLEQAWQRFENLVSSFAPRQSE